MRVLTQNLWGIRGNWEARREVLRERLRLLEPDPVAFIEAIKTDEYDQVAGLLGDGSHIAHQSEREPEGQGTPIYAPLIFANHVPSWQLQFERERELPAIAASDQFGVVADLEPPR